MARLPYLDPENDEVADRVRARRGGHLHPLDQVLLHSPPMADGWNSMLSAVRRQSSLPDDVRETVILRVAALNGARYEWEAHRPLALAAGMDERQVEHLDRPLSTSPLTPDQQVAADFTEALTLTCRVPEETFARARRAFGDRGVVDLAVTVGAYNMVSRFLTALDVDEQLSREGSASAPGGLQR